MALEMSTHILQTLNSTENRNALLYQWQRILLGIVMVSVMLLTIVGNCLVLVAIYKEKKLHTVFNMYIVNLAVTDIGVAVPGMLLYAIYVMLGNWPFGHFVCGFWIFWCFGMSLVSIFTLMVISIDRFWSVTWSVHYRSYHNKKKSYLCIALVWTIMILLWLPACIVDRLKNQIPHVCIWEASLNPEYALVIAVVGQLGPCVVVILCYFQVLCFMKKRGNVGPLNKKKCISTIDRSNTESSVAKTPTYLSNKAVSTANPEFSLTMSREKKVFVTLSYIIVGYIICLVPFHIVFFIRSVKPDSVPNVVFTITFSLACLNSTINPVLYNLSSLEFRHAFRKVLCRQRSS